MKNIVLNYSKLEDFDRIKKKKELKTDQLAEKGKRTSSFLCLFGLTLEIMIRSFELILVSGVN
jgi:hypothetical protein